MTDAAQIGVGVAVALLIIDRVFSFVKPLLRKGNGNGGKAIESRVQSVESEIVRLREAKHDMGNDMQEMKYRILALEGKQ